MQALTSARHSKQPRAGPLKESIYIKAHSYEHWTNSHTQNPWKHSLDRAYIRCPEAWIQKDHYATYCNVWLSQIEQKQHLITLLLLLNMHVITLGNKLKKKSFWCFRFYTRFYAYSHTLNPTRWIKTLFTLFLSGSSSFWDNALIYDICVYVCITIMNTSHLNKYQQCPDILNPVMVSAPYPA